MTPYHQIEKHDPANDLYGDCLRTAIGCLIDREPHMIPHFAKLAEQHGQSGEDMWETIRDWLQAAEGLTPFMLYYNGEMQRDEILSSIASLNPNQYYLLLGMSADDVGHVVICCNDHVVHDPSWTQCSVVKPMESPDGTLLWIVITLVSAKLLAPGA